MAQLYDNTKADTGLSNFNLLGVMGPGFCMHCVNEPIYVVSKIEVLSCAILSCGRLQTNTRDLVVYRQINMHAIESMSLLMIHKNAIHIFSQYPFLCGLTIAQL